MKADHETVKSNTIIILALLWTAQWSRWDILSVDWWPAKRRACPSPSRVRGEERPHPLSVSRRPREHVALAVTRPELHRGALFARTVAQRLFPRVVGSGRLGASVLGAPHRRGLGT